MGNRGDTCLRVCATVGGAVAATRRVGRFAQGTYVVKMAAIDTGPTVSLRFRRRPRGPGPSKDQSLDVRDRSRLDDQRRVFRQQESLFPPSCRGGATGESGEAGVLTVHEISYIEILEGTVGGRGARGVAVIYLPRLQTAPSIRRHETTAVLWRRNGKRARRDTETASGPGL